jgi:hypothetical protein
MMRLASLATLIVLSTLITGSLPAAQSFDPGRITINSPIILRTPSTGPLEANRPLPPPVATARARQLVSTVLRRLTAIASQNPAVGRGEQSTSPGGNVPQKNAVPRNEGSSLPSLPGLLPASVPVPLPSPAPLVAGPAAPPPPATTAQGADAQNQALPDAPAAVNPTSDTGPARPPSRSGAKGDDRDNTARSGVAK